MDVTVFCCFGTADKELLFDAPQFRGNCFCAEFIAGNLPPAGTGVKRVFWILRFLDFFAAPAKVRLCRRPGGRPPEGFGSKASGLGPGRGGPCPSESFEFSFVPGRHSAAAVDVEAGVFP
jgi:hypothetical protein